MQRQNHFKKSILEMLLLAYETGAATIKALCSVKVWCDEICAGKSVGTLYILNLINVSSILQIVLQWNFNNATNLPHQY